MTRGKWTLSLAVVLVLTLVGGVVTVISTISGAGRTQITAYFTNSTGIYTGDDVRILGVRVGEIDSIEAQPQQVKVTFWVDDRFEIPSDAQAVILSPSLVSARAIQLVPAYDDGPVMADQSVIPLERTAVPVEWDDLRGQLEKLVAALQPTQPGGVSTLGEFVNTAAQNLRGSGADIHDTIIQLSQAFSALGDHSDDIFGTIRDLSLVVTALQDSKEVLQALNTNLAATTALLVNQPGEVDRAIADINDVVADVSDFATENREPVGTTADLLASISDALNESLDELEQTLHVAPTQLANFVNMYPPAVGGFAGAFSLNNFANPIQFLCGAVEAASRLGAEQAAKLCVQYLAPIVKNRQYNFPPLGFNPVVGAVARPNEITYSEDWLRPDYVPPPQQHPAEPGTQAPALPAEVPAGSSLQDMLLPTGGGS